MTVIEGPTSTIAATVRLVAAVAKSGNVSYAEIVSSIPAGSVGPDARDRIDELIETTAAAMQTVGGARLAKVVVVLNPADPPMAIRNTVYCLIDGDADYHVIAGDLNTVVTQVGADVPGYRLKQEIQFESVSADNPLHIPEIGSFTGTKVTALVEVATENSGLPT
ncbi:hypothetical protein [Mycolicibacterium sp. CBMA 234]|uniref:hypothetical protein n=1 Tax=Mycolicibacterium sp. CBMA 234 TaxID=1918495 RepID=UPI0012DCFC28|nr:hypothetical protein [Mycolicibacterium sp. CBMA 234]